jgi:hypothetical protein
MPLDSTTYAHSLSKDCGDGFCNPRACYSTTQPRDTTADATPSSGHRLSSRLAHLEREARTSFDKLLRIRPNVYDT